MLWNSSGNWSGLKGSSFFFPFLCIFFLFNLELFLHLMCIVALRPLCRYNQRSSILWCRRWREEQEYPYGMILWYMNQINSLLLTNTGYLTLFSILLWHEVLPSSLCWLWHFIRKEQIGFTDQHKTTHFVFKYFAYFVFQQLMECIVFWLAVITDPSYSATHQNINSVSCSAELNYFCMLCRLFW